MIDINIVEHKLQELAQKSHHDPEGAHYEADQLLIKVIMQLYPNSQIEELFNQIERWYA